MMRFPSRDSWSAKILQTLYQENRFCKGMLAIRGRAVGPSCIQLPTLAVANTMDEIAPPASVLPFLEGMSRADTRLIEYSGEAGVVLQAPWHTCGSRRLRTDLARDGLLDKDPQLEHSL